VGVSGKNFFQKRIRGLSGLPTIPKIISFRDHESSNQLFNIALTTYAIAINGAIKISIIIIKAVSPQE
jgi:hypothetical protein